ncbi:MAG: glycosyltransferase family 61 protein [Cytophagaceae bacterium]
MQNILFPKIEVRRTKPVNLRQEDNAFFEKEYSRQFEVVNLHYFSKAMIFENGMIFHKWKIVSESLPSKDWQNRFQLKFLLRKLISLKKRKAPTNKKILIVTDEWSPFYFHWILDVLPKLYLLKDQLEEYILLLPQTCRLKYHSESLRFFDKLEIAYLDTRSITFAENVFLPDHIAPTGNYNPEVVQGLRSLISSKLAGRLTLNLGAQIYISRAKAEKRKVSNEAEIVAYLESIGYKSVCFEDYDFISQISIARHASSLVSIHGAGLSNMLFMEKGNVLEFRKEGDGHNNCYFALASALNMRYAYQFCKITNMDASSGEADIYVDLEQLKSNLLILSSNVR